MPRLLIWILSSLPTFVFAQFTYVIDQSIPVLAVDESNYNMPWAGGLNSTQYNTMDLNHDGIDDLVLFDRMANKVITYVRSQEKFLYAPEFEKLFPESVSGWLLLRDYNCDGLKDIFTADVLGIRVYTNTTEKGENLSWREVIFRTESGFKSEVLLTKGFTQKGNLQLQFDDLPAIIDVDGDGDLDIFNMKYVGTGTVEFHKNFGIERYGTCDSLDFERITQSWGNFQECHCGTFAFNGAECAEGGRVKHISGKTLLALDANGDNQMDLVMGEGECNELFLLQNEGTLLSPSINASSSFPQANPANVAEFPAAYYEDVDDDGKKDLLVSPNLFHKESLEPRLDQSNWFYKNTGTTSNPQLSLVTTRFLQRDMIDVGDNSKPSFADMDGDGDLDLFVSNNYQQNAAQTSLFKNVGTASHPSFIHLDPDYLNFSQYSFYNLKIQFYDIDRNGTVDLVFTATSLANQATDIHYIANKSQTKLDFSGQPVVDIDFTLLYHDNVTFSDVDLDGRPDMLIGRNNGSLEYWRNTSGNAGQFTFALTNDSYLGLNTSDDRQNISCAIGDLDEDGLSDLVFGDHEGMIQIIRDFRHANEITSETIYNPLLTAYTNHNLGGHIWPAIAKISDVDKPFIVVGNTLGGLYALRNDGGQSIPENPIIDVYPNPYEKSKTLKVKISEAATVQVLSVTGQQLNDPVSLEAHELYHYHVAQLARGIYLLRFTVDKKSFTRRLVVL
jgi:hypothetical protein